MEKTYWEAFGKKAIRQYEKLYCDKLSGVMSRSPEITTETLTEELYAIDLLDENLSQDASPWLGGGRLANIRAGKTLASREDVEDIASILSKLRGEPISPQDIASEYIKDISDYVTEMICAQRQEITKEKQLPPQDEQYSLLLGYLQGICQNMSAPKYAMLIAGFNVGYHLQNTTFEFLMRYLALNEKGRVKMKELAHERQPYIAGVLNSLKYSKCTEYILPLFQSPLSKDVEADQYLYMTEDERWEALKGKLDEKYAAGGSEFTDIVYFILDRAEHLPDMILSFGAMTGDSKQIKENADFWGIALAYELLSYYKEGGTVPRKS